MSSRSQILSLYKIMLKESAKFPDFNFRSYAVRRIRDGFKQAKNLNEPAQIQKQVEYARQNLEVIKRQAMIGHMFDIHQKLSIEVAAPSRQN